MLTWNARRLDETRALLNTKERARRVSRKGHRTNRLEYVYFWNVCCRPV